MDGCGGCQGTGPTLTRPSLTGTTAELLRTQLAAGMKYRFPRELVYTGLKMKNRLEREGWFTFHENVSVFPPIVRDPVFMVT